MCDNNFYLQALKEFQAANPQNRRFTDMTQRGVAMKETFDYPKRLDPKGRTIINEKCSCGHLRTQHDPRGDLGHGACTACFCGQFTWVGFVFASKRRKKVGRL